MKDVIHTDAAPAAVGPYSQAIRLDAQARLVYLSGQIGLDPRTGELVSDTFDHEVRQAFANLKAVTEAAGASSRTSSSSRCS